MMTRKTKVMLATAAVLGCGVLARPIFAPVAAQAQAQPGQTGQAGRYQLTAHLNTLYFVDTATGRAWSAAVETPKREWWPLDTPVARAK